MTNSDTTNSDTTNSDTTNSDAATGRNERIETDHPEDDPGAPTDPAVTTEDDTGAPTDPAVTTETVEGDVDYDRLLEQFGADRLSGEQARRFPDHPLVRRSVFYAGRDVDRFLDAAESGRPHSIVTGVGPSGPMHLGHVMPFYLAKRIQEATGAYVYVPLSDDEKYFTRDLEFESIGRYTRENLRDLVAVGFDPERTRFVIDTADADVVYPAAARIAKYLTQSTVEATYGDPGNVGQSFYPAVQATHLLLPQLVEGRHATLVPIAVDQDPHVRVCRDVAGKTHLPVDKPAALLGKFLPGLGGPGKMSSSDDAPSIRLDDDPETVAEKVRTYAYSGGRSSLEEHREKGGDPSVDVAYQYLQYFLEDDDDEVERIAREYRQGDLLSGEMKGLAVDAITDFLADHQSRRPDDDELHEAVDPYRLTDDERRQALDRAGIPGGI